MTEWIDEHTPEPMSSSEYESDLEGWIASKSGHGKVLTPGPHFPRHMHKHMTHDHGNNRHRHSRNSENEMSDRLRFNINYMEVPQRYNGFTQSNDILMDQQELANLIESDNDAEANLFDTHYGH